MHKFTCSKCKHTWIPRIDCPAQCPKCKTYNYMKERPTKKMINKAKALVK